MLSMTHPAGTPSGGARVQETYAYDAGPTFQGLWIEKFENDALAGVPDDEGLSDNLNFNWGTGSPPGIGNNDHWSVRLSGYLDITGNNATKYDFRVTGTMGTRSWSETRSCSTASTRPVRP